MPVTLHDSLTRRLIELKPSHADGVYRFYNCGPTVYAPAHIGNFRTFVVNDLIRRVLELEFGAEKVKHVRNITDVDDKTIRRSREEGRPLTEVTKQWTDKFHADCDALNCLRPHVEPTATGHIPEQVGMIAELMQKGHAYASADGSVYFKVGSFPGYGALSRVKERELQVGSTLSHKPQTADADEKEDGSDFALWKAWKPEDGDVKWTGPLGAAAGRPGWHIECSAMSKKHLGETIDLHTGGVDLLFPHHENEIAQSECCTGHQLAKHWYHSEHLLVDGKKMSKSLGNMYTLDDLKAKGFSPMALRYTLLDGDPRKQLSFTLESMHGAEKQMKRLRKFTRDLCEVAKLDFEKIFGSDAKEQTLASIHRKPFQDFWHTLTDGLDSHSAIVALFTQMNEDWNWIEQHADDPTEFERQRDALRQSADEYQIALFALGLSVEEPTTTVPAEVKALAELRWAAKQAKNWAEADRLRAAITAAGWSMLDSKTDYKLEPAKKV